ncbi:MAG: DHHA1 domain-containing protein [Candidatus Desantisbacteria bacterium]
MVKIGKFSLELCGGTHLDRSGSVGPFKMLTEQGVAAGVRRIEALTGKLAYSETLKEKETLTLRWIEVMKARDETGKEIERLKRRLILTNIDEMIGSASEIGGIKVVCKQLDGAGKEDIASVVDVIASKIGTGCIVMAATCEKNVFWAVKVTKDLTAKIDARALIKELTRITGGGGGGRPDFATGGGKIPEKIQEAMENVKRLISV